MQSSSNQSTGVSRLLKSSLMEKIKVFKMEEIKKMSEDYKDKLGDGGFSSVFKGSFGKFPLVIKKYEIDASKGFDTEVLNLHRVRHPNIVKLLGVSVDERDPCVVLEYASNGTLDDYIKKKSNVKLNKIEKLKIFIDLSDALVYLYNKHLIHRDIKPGNILLTNYKQAKYADFNISRYYDKDERNRLENTKTKLMGTPAYTCPTWLSIGQCGAFTDIYSLGLTMLVVMSGNKKTYEVYNEAEKIIDDGNNERLKNFFVDKWKEEVAMKILKIGYACIRFNRKERPTARHLARKLREILKKVIEDNEEEENAEERITKLEIKNRQLYKKRNKLKESIDKIKNDNIKIEKEIQEIKSYLENQRDDLKFLVNEVVESKKELKQCEKLIIENRVLSKSYASRLPQDNQRKQYAVLYTNMEKGTRYKTSVENKGMQDCFLSNVINLPDDEGMYICYETKWLEENFHIIAEMCNAIYLYNIEQIDLRRSLMLYGNDFKLISNDKTSLKLSTNAKIISRGECKVMFEGIDIVGCNYGEVNAIAILENASLEWRRSEVKRNEGKHALIRMVGEETKLELEEVNFEINKTTETLPIIINAAVRMKEGKIKINKCKFVNHDCFGGSFKMNVFDALGNAPFLIRSTVREMKIENCIFENNKMDCGHDINCVLINHNGWGYRYKAPNTVDINNTNFIKCFKCSSFFGIYKINVKNCLFFENVGFIYNRDSGTLEILECNEVRMEETDFVKNHSILGNGGAVSFCKINELKLNKCNFEGNHSTESGGAIVIQKSLCKMMSCHFKNNDCDRDGFDIYNHGARIISDDRCTFISEIITHNNISICNCRGTFNGSEDDIYKNDN